jgi:hypothetical protein
VVTAASIDPKGIIVVVVVVVVYVAFGILVLGLVPEEPLREPFFDFLGRAVVLHIFFFVLFNYEAAPCYVRMNCIKHRD